MVLWEKKVSEERILILTIHKDNLKKAKTFEEYRDAHVAYIDTLIGRFEAEMHYENVIKRFVDKSENNANNNSNEN